MTNKFIKSKKLNEDKNVESIGHAEGFCNMSYPLFEGRFVLPNLVKQFQKPRRKIKHRGSSGNRHDNSQTERQELESRFYSWPNGDSNGCFMAL